MAFVLDASVTVAWGLRDEADALADLALERLDAESASVPAIWWFAVRNVLLVNARRRRISASATSTLLRALAGMNIAVGRAPPVRATLATARPPLGGARHPAATCWFLGSRTGRVHQPPAPGKAIVGGCTAVGARAAGSNSASVWRVSDGRRRCMCWPVASPVKPK